METNDGIDGHIIKIIDGKKDLLEIMCALRRDLISKDGRLLDRWDKIYGSLSSCKNIADPEKYNAAMKEKYIRTYKACIEEFEKQSSEK